MEDVMWDSTMDLSMVFEVMLLVAAALEVMDSDFLEEASQVVLLSD